MLAELTDLVREAFERWAQLDQAEQQRQLLPQAQPPTAISARTLIRLREAVAGLAGSAGPGMDGAGAGLTAAGFGAAVP
ncbi:hypothetical protein ACFU98_46540 [Streptomyces sp. NPDC057575]|uniref:hypothetical protein n=1 Tax=unclassified Streptomyces TaxID=2593676 RepID=UPI0036C63ABF